MEVILLERVAKLGAMGAIVKVKDGYARNYLLRGGKALRATEANKQKFERDRAMLEARNAERRSSAETEARQLDGKSFVLIRQAGESGQLYGSVSPRDIAEAAHAAGSKLERSHIELEKPIKTVGLYTVKVSPHPEVDVTITVNVAVATWLINSDGSLIDPRRLGTSSTLRSFVRSRIGWRSGCGGS